MNYSQIKFACEPKAEEAVQYDILEQLEFKQTLEVNTLHMGVHGMRNTTAITYEQGLPGRAAKALKPMANRSKGNYNNARYGIKLFYQTIFFHFKNKATLAAFHNE